MKMKAFCCAVLAGLGTMGTWAADDDVVTDPQKKFSYSLGMSLGNNLKRSYVDLSLLDLDSLARGLRDVAAGHPLLDDAQARKAITDYTTEALNQAGARNKKAAEDFLAANQNQPGVVTTASGLQYKVLAEGAGESPTAKDTVTVHYRGTLLDGTEFDSSYARNQPASFAADRVIKGWTEALQLMRPGAKWQLWIKPDLAYGPNGRPPTIPPNSLLNFEVELLSFQSSPQPAAPAQPVTSDIIKVPSKEELEKGAKIEVIKAADLEKYKQQEAEKARQAAEKAATEKKD